MIPVSAAKVAHFAGFGAREPVSGPKKRPRSPELPRRAPPRYRTNACEYLTITDRPIESGGLGVSLSRSLSNASL